jgi:hypothetical protein
VTLANNVQELWSASTTTPEDRKRILRTLVSQVIVRNATKEVAELELVWTGGLRQALPVVLPRGVQRLVVERAGREASVPRITEELQAAGVLTATGRPISANVVREKLRQAGIPTVRQQAWNVANQLILKALEDGVQRSELLRQLNEQTAAELGAWTPQRLADVICDLRHHPSNTARLPEVLPAIREKENVLNSIKERVKAGDSDEAIAQYLNTQGLKPQRGPAFNRNIVYQLRLRSDRGIGRKSQDSI